MVRNIRLKCRYSPGDIMTLTAAIYSLHKTYPGEYTTSVQTFFDEIFYYNPDIVAQDRFDSIFRMRCPTVKQCNERGITFLSGYTSHLSYLLKRPLELQTNRPVLYLNEEEQSNNPISKPFWLVSPGLKPKGTAKGWPIEYYQDVIDKTKDIIHWVQIGAERYQNPILNNVESLVGLTSTRRLIHIAAHCDGGLGPVTWLQHLCAAFEKPYICLLGGREPATWVQYPKQHTLHTIGSLPCCQVACWKDLVEHTQRIGTLCERPNYDFKRSVPECMSLIKPKEVLNILERIIYEYNAA